MIRRRLLNLAPELSLLLCVATGLCWTVGIPWWDAYLARYDAARRFGYGMSAERAGVRLGGLTTAESRGERLGPWRHSGLSDRQNDGPQPVGGSHRLRSLAGFLFFRGAHDLVSASGDSLNVSVVIVQIPYGFIAAASAILPLRRVVHSRRVRARKRLDLCPHCGYDLRASFGRCPECGAPVATDADPQAA